MAQSVTFVLLSRKECDVRRLVLGMDRVFHLLNGTFVSSWLVTSRVDQPAVYVKWLMLPSSPLKNSSA